MYRHGTMLLLAVSLMLIGVVGMLGIAIQGAGSALVNSAASNGPNVSLQRGLGDFGSNGERIYFTGIGHNGPIRTNWNPGRFFGGMMGRRNQLRGISAPGCVNCHGTGGRGGRLAMMGLSAVVPDIRYSTLTTPQVDASGTVSPAWTQPQIERAIREGVEPSGSQLDPLMPRWKMDATDMRDTIDYLKELSR